MIDGCHMTWTEEKRVKDLRIHMMSVITWDNIALWEGRPPVVSLAYTYTGPHYWPQWSSSAMGEIVGNVNVRAKSGSSP